VFRTLVLFFCFSLLFLSSAQARVKKSVAYAASAPVSTSAVAFRDFSKISMGFEGGIGLGQTEVTEGGATPGGISERQSFGGGVTFDFPVSAFFSISPGLFYLSKGINAEMQGGKTEFRFDFLEVPVLARVYFTTGDFRPFIFAGPSVGIPLSKQSVSADGTASNIDGGGLVDLSAQFGVGTDIALGGNVGLLLSGRYLHGFVDQTTLRDQSFYNRTFLFTAGFRIGL